ncbi:alpha,alpha-trehalase TreA [Halotalea alkalilenta]|uniref:alpha,alpha-trehalase TreA n=1 Tax=Halotalea alkalilenta TaxID=376489 RepID=UPI0005BB61FA|nr:alpha,alpha-trehalase TreA [Halotalea alkalilenta]
MIDAATQLELPNVPPPPDELWGELFIEVQRRGLFEDSKTFVDLVPRGAPEAVLREFSRLQAAGSPSDEALGSFVETHFAPQDAEDVELSHQQGDRLGEDCINSHIDTLWGVLTRRPQASDNPYSSRLQLPYPFVVPGGRFNEIYYWDSYFTILGLQESARFDLIRDMVNNFAYLIDEFGHIPNGNRNYFLSRSQPPYFADMVDLLALIDGAETYRLYLPQLEAEYAYWMDGADDLPPGEAHRRVVRLADGALLNRYWDDADKPRPESYREDLETAHEAPKRDERQVWRDLRAGCESGWDFTSRWLTDDHRLSTIRTTAIAPIDLNCLIHHLEATLYKIHESLGHAHRAEFYHERHIQRRNALLAHFWDEEQGVFGDLLWRECQLTGVLSAACCYPLYYAIATPDQARATAATLEARLLADGGLLTTAIRSGQQWDAPNGWAPLQWVSVIGLRHYGEHDLAAEIARRWIGCNVDYYYRRRKLIEKYDVVTGGTASGGEYPAQDGFGWTNGVLSALLALYPEHHPGHCA